jgi:hypothetical protein
MERRRSVGRLEAAHSNLGDRTGAAEPFAVADQASVLRGGLAV